MKPALKISSIKPESGYTWTGTIGGQEYFVRPGDGPHGYAWFTRQQCDVSGDPIWKPAQAPRVSDLIKALFGFAGS